MFEEQSKLEPQKWDYQEQKCYPGQDLEMVDPIDTSIGVLTFTYQQTQTTMCTAIFVTKDIVLTAAHCVFNCHTGQFHPQIHVYPLVHSKQVSRNKSYQVVYKNKRPVIHIPAEYFKRPVKNNKDYDYAFVKIQPFAKNVGRHKCAKLGINCPNLQKEKVTLTIRGYPYDRELYHSSVSRLRVTATQYQRTETRKLSKDYKPGDFQIQYCISTHGGQSGSPIYNKGGFVIGIHLGRSRSRKFNVGRLIDIDLLTQLKYWATVNKCDQFLATDLSNSLRVPVSYPTDCKIEQKLSLQLAYSQAQSDQLAYIIRLESENQKLKSKVERLSQDNESLFKKFRGNYPPKTRGDGLKPPPKQEKNPAKIKTKQCKAKNQENIKVQRFPKPDMFLDESTADLTEDKTPGQNTTQDAVFQKQNKIGVTFKPIKIESHGISFESNPYYHTRGEIVTRSNQKRQWLEPLLASRPINEEVSMSVAFKINNLSSYAFFGIIHEDSQIQADTTIRLIAQYDLDSNCTTVMSDQKTLGGEDLHVYPGSQAIVFITVNLINKVVEFRVPRQEKDIVWKINVENQGKNVKKYIYIALTTFQDCISVLPQ